MSGFGPISEISIVNVESVGQGIIDRTLWPKANSIFHKRFSLNSLKRRADIENTSSGDNVVHCGSHFVGHFIVTSR